MIEMRVDRDVIRPIFYDLLLPLFFLIVIEPTLILVFETPEMTVQIHRHSFRLSPRLVRAESNLESNRLEGRSGSPADTYLSIGFWDSGMWDMQVQT
jgi:hypothetical protein